MKTQIHTQENGKAKFSLSAYLRKSIFISVIGTMFFLISPTFNLILNAQPLDTSKDSISINNKELISADSLEREDYNDTYAIAVTSSITASGQGVYYAPFIILHSKIGFFALGLYMCSRMHACLCVYRCLYARARKVLHQRRICYIYNCTGLGAAGPPGHADQNSFTRYLYIYTLLLVAFGCVCLPPELQAQFCKISVNPDPPHRSPPILPDAQWKQPADCQRASCRKTSGQGIYIYILGGQH